MDEAGRGAWAGPVVAAAVILPTAVEVAGIDDSKRLTPLQREAAFGYVHKVALGVGVGIAEVGEVDTLGVAQASYLAMQRAVDNLPLPVKHILVDGFRVNFTQAPSTGLINGDQRSVSVAAASIVAKVVRDRLMIEGHQKYPRFGFAIHKGYGTKLHQERIQRHGVCAVHRKSFAPVRDMLRRGAKQSTLNS